MLLTQNPLQPKEFLMNVCAHPLSNKPIAKKSEWHLIEPPKYKKHDHAYSNRQSSHLIYISWTQALPSCCQSSFRCRHLWTSSSLQTWLQPVVRSSSGWHLLKRDGQSKATRRWVEGGLLVYHVVIYGTLRFGTSESLGTF